LFYYVYINDLWISAKLSHTHTHTHAHTHTHTYIYIYSHTCARTDIYIYI